MNKVSDTGVGERDPWQIMDDWCAKQSLDLLDWSNAQIDAGRGLNDPNDEDEPIIQVIGAAVGGVVPSAGLGYDDEAARDAGFEKVCQETAEPQAKAFYDMLVKMFPKSAGVSA